MKILDRSSLPAVPIEDLVDRIGYRFSLSGETNEERAFILNNAVPDWLHRNLHADKDGTAVHIYTDDGYDFGYQQIKFWWGPKFVIVCDQLADRWYRANIKTIKNSVPKPKHEPDMFDYAFELADWCLANNGEFDVDNIVFQCKKKYNIDSNDELTQAELVDFLESL